MRTQTALFDLLLIVKVWRPRGEGREERDPAVREAFIVRAVLCPVVWLFACLVVCSLAGCLVGWLVRGVQTEIDVKRLVLTVPLFGGSAKHPVPDFADFAPIPEGL